jgi:hypothetical protein
MFWDANENEDQDEVERVAKLAGKLYARVKDHGNGWSMCFLTLDVIDNGAILGRQSMGGVESDMSADDWSSVVGDLVWFAREEVGEIDGLNWDEAESKVVDAAIDWLY